MALSVTRPSARPLRFDPGEVAALLFAGTGAAGAPDLAALSAAAPGAAPVVERVLDTVQEAVRDSPPAEGAAWPSLRAALLGDADAYREAVRVPGVAQLASYTASVAVDQVLRAGGLRPGFAVGQSFGEIAAMVCAQVFTIADGARMAAGLVRVLSRHGAGGGLGLLAAGEAEALECIRRAGADAGPGQVVVACLNAPQATVVSGPDEPLERVLAAARGSGVRSARLAIPYLSHHPAMAGADLEWYAMIRRFPQRPLRVPVYSPVRGRAYRDDDDLHRALADCIVKPVRLPETLQAVRRAGATVFVEAGAGDALCQCAQLSVPGAPTLAPMPPPPREPRPPSKASSKGTS
ncbi:ACP S-malonyltransferase [Actinomadura hibisca]|uniref:ACP S-malonyltransferase n=1 Tax=Actinomadura hibisca TaxID=68565 RepID=UPI00082D6325|nr:acyltransferase domain-containing protein [Actinomadura hibisca]